MSDTIRTYVVHAWDRDAAHMRLTEIRAYSPREAVEQFDVMRRTLGWDIKGEFRIGQAVKVEPLETQP